MGQKQRHLGREVEYVDHYSSKLLDTFARSEQRERLSASQSVEYSGFDVWLAHEFSWLGPHAPNAAKATISVDCNSPSIVESKSMKLYLGSYAMTKFSSRQEVEETLVRDLSDAFDDVVNVVLENPQQATHSEWDIDTHTCLDNEIPVQIASGPNVNLLAKIDSETSVRETLFTTLFRCICPVTAQPDTATILIDYQGRTLPRSEVLGYLLSYRTYASFHETVTEQIFSDLQESYAPSELNVYGFFSRRGGIDITPIRSTTATVNPRVRPPWM